MRKINWGIVGLGNVANSHLRTFKKLENSSKLQYFVINDSNITQLVDM